METIFATLNWKEGNEITNAQIELTRAVSRTGRLSELAKADWGAEATWCAFNTALLAPI